MKAVNLVLITLLLAGCSSNAIEKPISATTVCILAMCETADRIERTGDQDAAGDISDTTEETTDLDQGEEGQLEVPAV